MNPIRTFRKHYIAFAISFLNICFQHPGMSQVTNDDLFVIIGSDTIPYASVFFLKGSTNEWSKYDSSGYYVNMSTITKRIRYVDDRDTIYRTHISATENRHPFYNEKATRDDFDKPPEKPFEIKPVRLKVE